MSMSITPEINGARLAGLLAYLDSGTGSAKIRIYGGTRPALPTDAASGSLLVEITLTNPCGSVTGGTASLTQAAADQITSSGTATWARVVRGGESTGIDGSVSDNAGDGDVKINDVQLWAGGFVALVSAVLE